DRLARHCSKSATKPAVPKEKITPVPVFPQLGSHGREISRPAVAPRQPRRRSILTVLVVVAPPEARLVAPFRGAVEPLVHAPEAVQSARIGGVAMVDDTILEHKGAHARP